MYEFYVGFDECSVYCVCALVDDCSVIVVVECDLFKCSWWLGLCGHLCSGCDGSYVFCLIWDACSFRCLCMGSISVSSCKCCVCSLLRF